MKPKLTIIAIVCIACLLMTALASATSSQNIFMKIQGFSIFNEDNDISSPKKTSNFADQVNELLEDCTPDQNGLCYIPIEVDTPVALSLTNLVISYDGDEPLNKKPVPVPSVSVRSGVVPLSVVFDGSDSYDPDGEIDSYEWVFGDGDSSSGKGPLNHVYSRAGNYQATLIVTDDSGESSSEFIVISVTESENEIPIAEFSVTPQTGDAPLSVHLDASASSDQDGEIVEYAWDYGDGSQLQYGSDKVHIFESIGTFTVTLTIKDGKGAIDSKSVNIVVTEKELFAPMAIMHNSVNEGQAPLEVSFDGSFSSDSDGTIVSYLWDFGDGSSASGIDQTHVYDDEGVFVAKLTVTDNDGLTSSANAQITVNERENENPICFYSVDKNSGDAPLTITVNSSESYDSDGQITEFKWDWADGSSFDFDPETSHTFMNPGMYIVKLTCTDNRGGQTVTTGVYNVTERLAVPPVAILESSKEIGEAPLSVVFDGRKSSDKDGSIVSSIVSFGDGQSYEGLGPVTHVYNIPGLYDVVLSVVDDDGLNSVSSVKIRVTEPVNEAPLAQFTNNHDSGYVPLGVVFDAGISYDPDGEIVNYAWDWGDGSSIQYGSYKAHVFNSAGEYTVTLTVTDDKGSTSVTSKVIVVIAKDPIPPVAVIKKSVTEGFAPLDVVFTASDSSDEDGTIVDYSWDFGDESTENGLGPHLHSYVDKGSYDVTLTVKDDDGLVSTDSTVIQVNEKLSRPPTAKFTVSPSTISVRKPAYFDASQSSDPDGDELVYEWNFGDGQTGSGKSVSHRYAWSWSYVTPYVVTLKVTDSTGKSDVFKKTIYVRYGWWGWW